MKIAYVDTSVDGHHVSYLTALVAANQGESVLILPERLDFLDCKQCVFKTVETQKRTLKTYYRWVKEIASIVEAEKPDIVHFLYADTFYRFFGLGLSLFKKYNTTLTIHWAKSGFLGKVSTNLLCRCVDHVVVHSSYIKDLFLSYGVKNVSHIEYPNFSQITVDKSTACKFWGLSEEIPTIACIGHTRADKGLDILLDALQRVDRPFQLLVAGKEDAINRASILEKAAPFKDKLHLHLKYLDAEELANAFAACDIVALPYRRAFNGASGPLGEGVSLGKCIVGANHGNLGDTIEKNHLGYTFGSEDVQSLTKVLKQALSCEFAADDVYKQYQDSLNVDHFVASYVRLYELQQKPK